MAFDVEGARQAGYSDAEIVDHLAAETKFDAAGARKAGYTDTQLLEHLAKPAPPPEPPTPGFEGNIVVPGATTFEGGVVKHLMHPPPPAAPAAESPPATPGFEGNIVVPGAATVEGGGVLGRVGSAAVRGYQESPPILTPQARAAVDQAGPIGRFITNPLLDVAGGALGVMSGVAGGIGQTAYEAGAAIDPRLGRDLYMLQQVAPAAEMVRQPQIPNPNRLMVPERPPAPAAPEPRALPAPEPPLLQGVPPVAPEVAARVTERPAAPSSPLPGEPQPGMGGPQSVGAAASHEGTPAWELSLTPKEEQAYRSTAEGSKLIEPQQPSFTDRTEYIPGITITAPEMLQTAEAAREFKNLKAKNPQLADAEQVAADKNNTLYTNHFDGMAGSPRALQLAEQERDAAGATARERLWARQQPTDPQPVLTTAKEILDGPEGRRAGVRNAVNETVKELFDADGNLITEPRLLYGVRQHITDMLEAKDITGRKINAVAIGQLTRLKEVLDGVIESGAAGFGDYLSEFAQASRRIDEMKALQGYRTSLFDSHGIIQPGRVQKMMKDIVDARAARSLEPEKSITPETMQGLWALRDSLRRKAAAERLAKAPGSDTAQNFFDAVREHAEGGVGKLAAAGMGAMWGPLGIAGGALVQDQFSKFAQARRYRRGLEMINPPQNRLAVPPTPPPAP